MLSYSHFSPCRAGDPAQQPYYITSRWGAFLPFRSLLFTLDELRDILSQYAPSCIELFSAFNTYFVDNLQEGEKHKRVSAEIPQATVLNHLHNLPGRMLPLITLSLDILLDKLTHLFRMHWRDYRPIYMPFID